jgi:hypothetical protein
MPTTFLIKKTPPFGPFVGEPVELVGGGQSSNSTTTAYSQLLDKMICGYDGGNPNPIKFWYYRVNPASNILLASDVIGQGWDISPTNKTDCIFDPVTGHLVIAFRGPSSGVCGLHQFVGNDYIYSPTTEFNATRMSDIKVAHIPNSNKLAFVFIDAVTGFGPVAISIGEIVYENYLGKDQWYIKMIGSPVQVTSVNSTTPSIVFDPLTNQLIITYRNTSTFRINYRLCSIDNDGVVSFGTLGTIITGHHQPSVTYDPIEQRVVLICRDDSAYSGKAVIGTVSGSDIIDISSPVTFTSAIMAPRSTFDVNSEKVNVVYNNDLTFEKNVQIVSGKVTENSIVFGTSLVLDSGGNKSFPSIAYDNKNKLVVVTYLDTVAHTTHAITARLE